MRITEYAVHLRVWHDIALTGIIGPQTLVEKGRNFLLIVGPYIRPGNEMLLKSGMTFTIEPGVYMSGEFGVRIEDDVAVTYDGCEVLSKLSREFLMV